MGNLHICDLKVHGDLIWYSSVQTVSSAGSCCTWLITWLYSKMVSVPDWQIAFLFLTFYITSQLFGWRVLNTFKCTTCCFSSKKCTAKHNLVPFQNCLHNLDQMLASNIKSASVSEILQSVQSLFWPRRESEKGDYFHLADNQHNFPNRLS